MAELSGKVALVTGTARKRGIGRAITLQLARDGADIVVSDKHIPFDSLDPWDKEEGWHGLDSMVEEIKTLGCQAYGIPADMSSSQEIHDLVSKTVKKVGHIDIVVNNAALIGKDLGTGLPVIDLSEETWNKGIAVNLTGVFLMCKAAATQMIKQGNGGKIINIASDGGKRSVAGMATYCASKAAVISLTQTLALELGKYRINVNAVCPGVTVTWGTRGSRIWDLVKQGMSEKEAVAKVYDPGYSAKEGLAMFGPFGRPGTAEEIADMVGFLASRKADFITGQAISVDGGEVMSH